MLDMEFTTHIGQAITMLNGIAKKEQTLHLLNTTVGKTVVGGTAIMNLLTIAMFVFAIVLISSTTIYHSVLTKFFGSQPPPYSS